MALREELLPLELLTEKLKQRRALDRADLALQHRKAVRPGVDRVSNCFVMQFGSVLRTGSPKD